MDQRNNIDDVLTELFCEHPYLLDDVFIRSRKEAETICKDGFPSCDQIFERLKLSGKTSV